MATTNFTAWYDEVLPDVPGLVKQAVALNAIRNAAIEFCERALVWSYNHDSVSAAARIGLYDYSVPTNTLVVRPLEIWYRGEPLEYKAPAELSEWVGRDWRQAEGTPRYVTQVDDRQFYVVPKPIESAAGAITLRVALKPKRAATAIDSLVYEKWLDAITLGAKQRLLLMPKKPWTDMTTGAAMKALFDAEVVRARNVALSGWLPSRRRVRARFL